MRQTTTKLYRTFITANPSTWARLEFKILLKIIIPVSFYQLDISWSHQKRELQGGLVCSRAACEGVCRFMFLRRTAQEVMQSEQGSKQSPSAVSAWASLSDELAHNRDSKPFFPRDFWSWCLSEQHRTNQNNPQAKGLHVNDSKGNTPQNEPPPPKSCQKKSFLTN